MMVDGRLMGVSRYSWSTRPVRLTLLLRGICTVIGTRQRSFGRLLPQLRHVLDDKLRSLAAEREVTWLATAAISASENVLPLISLLPPTLTPPPKHESPF